MNLLLLLTAMIASLTGIGAGDRSVGQVQGVAVVRAVEGVQSAARAARHSVPMVALPQRELTARTSWAIADAQALLPTRLPFERRLE